MLKEILNLYNRQPQDVTGFSLRREGSKYIIYSNFADKPRLKIGRYNTYDEAKSVFEQLKLLTNCK